MMAFATKHIGTWKIWERNLFSLTQFCKSYIFLIYIKTTCHFQIHLWHVLIPSQRQCEKFKRTICHTIYYSTFLRRELLAMCIFLFIAQLEITLNNRVCSITGEIRTWRVHSNNSEWNKREYSSEVMRVGRDFRVVIFSDHLRRQ